MDGGGTKGAAGGRLARCGEVSSEVAAGAAELEAVTVGRRRLQALYHSKRMDYHAGCESCVVRRRSLDARSAS